MSYSLTRGVWEMRWRGGDGRQRSRRFGDDERAAQAFDEAIHDQKTKERKPAGYGESGGVYPIDVADRRAVFACVAANYEQQLVKRWCEAGCSGGVFAPSCEGS